MDINLSILFNHKRFEGLMQTYKMMGVTIEGFRIRNDIGKPGEFLNGALLEIFRAAKNEMNILESWEILKTNEDEEYEDVYILSVRILIIDGHYTKIKNMYIQPIQRHNYFEIESKIEYRSRLEIQNIYAGNIGYFGSDANVTEAIHIESKDRRIMRAFSNGRKIVTNGDIILTHINGEINLILSKVSKVISDNCIKELNEITHGAWGKYHKSAIYDYSGCFILGNERLWIKDIPDEMWEKMKRVRKYS